MSMLDVVALVVAVVAIGFGVVAVVRARSAEDKAGAAAMAAAHARERAESAAEDAAQAIERAGAARGDAATALDQATRARQGVVQAQANAAAAHQDAEQARADAERARLDAETATGALDTVRRSIGSVGAVGSTSAGESVEASAPVDPVAWKLEQVKPMIWLVRNTGSSTARSALLTDATQPPKFVRPDEVIPRAVPPGDHLQFRVQTTRGGPPPRVRVMWREDGATEPKTFDVTMLAE
ncbi:MAG: hypothetical protein EPN48_13300 [Microbacteriaceae bacterium]|nr:MAG: hypothetical protein EPN48_13300 [Microbacteriaceae bacterium]